jgi:6,7-dimethyl-8-ribityllumazine synthase
MNKLINSSVAVVVSQFNEEITDVLLHSFKESLMEKGWKEESVEVFYVPGAFEIPIIAQKLARTGRFQAIAALGCVIKGETAHFEYISEAVAHAIQRVVLDESIPIFFGVLTTYTEDQAKKRTLPPLDKGRELAEALIETLKTISAI